MSTYYSLSEVAETLRVGDKTITLAIKRGQLTAAKIGKAWRIKDADLNKYIKSRTLITHKSAS